MVGTIGARIDHMRVRGSGPRKDLVVGSFVARTHKNFTDINLVSAKSTTGTAL